VSDGKSGSGLEEEERRKKKKRKEGFNKWVFNGSNYWVHMR
jgi:hypothetical protein